MRGATERPHREEAPLLARHLVLTSTVGTMDEINGSDAATDTAATDETELVDEELLVEEISIDGMCGVY